MISELHIENIAVIKNLTLSFKNGFSVLTGETGAGKSIIIDSVNLLLGGRGAKDLIRTGENKALVSAYFDNLSEKTLKSLEEFDVYPESDGNIYITRTINIDGKTSAKINGRSVPASVLRDAGTLLLNIHGQHDSQLLLNPSKHINILDSYANTDKEISDYRIIFENLAELKRSLKKQTFSEQEIADRTETLKYKISEIESAKLKIGEEETLNEKRSRIKGIEKITRCSSVITSALSEGTLENTSASDKISEAIDAFSKLQEEFKDSEEIIKRLEFCKYELIDISETAAALSDPDITDPEKELDRIESRLEIISRLESKYGADIKTVLETKKQFENDLETLLNSEKNAEFIKKELYKKAKEAAKAAEILSDKRQTAALKLSELVTEQLHFLDLEKVRFSVAVTKTVSEKGTVHFAPNGCDNVEFLISTNPGEPLKPLSKIASGGELSRVMLGLKSVLSDDVQTLIFDEIDTGVSGKTSEKIGIRLSDLSKSCQVICITHSPQIAAIADTHYKITKNEIDGRAETTVKSLEFDERVEEISRIMGGIEITNTVRETAKEMLSRNRNK